MTQEQDYEMYAEDLGVSDFLKQCSFSRFYEMMRGCIIGQDEGLAEACCNVYRYLQANA